MLDTTNPPSKLQIWELFDGYSKAHGTYVVKRTSDRGKAEGKALTVQRPATPDVWDAHVAGTGPGLGIVPLRDDNTVVWGCIDIDTYNLKHDELEKKIRKLELPLVVARSKSGGAHCFVFCKHPIDASTVVEALTAWAAALGHGGCEIFPKQTVRHDETDTGNWLNMPYYDADQTLRFAYKDGIPLDFREFLEYAESMRVDEDAFTLRRESDSELFEDGPPCLQLLEADGGFPDGTRNDGMYNVAVYLRLRFPDEWQDKLQEYNVAMSDPPLGLNEIQTIAKSVAKKDYSYACRKEPICNRCDKRACIGRKFGVGQANSDGPNLYFGPLTKLVGGVGDEVFWFMEIERQRMRFTTPEFTTQASFQRKVADAVSRYPRKMSAARWDAFVDEKMRDCETIQVPEEATGIGAFRELLEQFLTGLAQSTEIDHLATRLDSPYQPGDGTVWFRLQGLQKYLKAHAFTEDRRVIICEWLRELGATDHNKRIKGKSIRYWTIQMPEVIEADTRPRLVGTEEF